MFTLLALPAVGLDYFASYLENAPGHVEGFTILVIRFISKAWLVVDALLFLVWLARNGYRFLRKLL
jgi:hypothetical protein